jgi:hypothetical protein
VQRTSEARVFRVGDRLFGCDFKVGRRRFLGQTYSAPEDSSGGGGITHLRLAGHFVAYVFPIDDSNSRIAGIYVDDLRRARNVYNWQLGPTSASPGVDIPDLAVAPTGSVAFTEAFYRSSDRTTLARVIVKRHDRRSHTVALDDDPAIDPLSLTRRGARVYWRHGAEERSAGLP